MASTSASGGGGGREGSGGGSKDEGRKVKVAEKREHRRGKKYQAYNLNTKEKIVKMLDDGARNCDIVRALNVPASTVRRLRKRKVEVKSQCASVRKYFTCKSGNPGQGQAMYIGVLCTCVLIYEGKRLFFSSKDGVLGQKRGTLSIVKD